MKKLMTIIIILIGLNVQAQSEKQVFYFGADLNLAINGAYEYDNTPALHFFFEGGTRFKNQDEFLIKISYANLPEYYYMYGLNYNKDFQIFTTNKVRTLIGASTLYLQRGFKDRKLKNKFLTLELNTKFNYFITDNIGISASIDWTWRRDLVSAYNETKILKVVTPSGKISLIIII